jgi:glycerol-1-phosphate dehydrogenase [NAD(P)+]
MATGVNGHAGDPLAQLLAGTWIDPDTGRPAGIGIESIVIADSLAGQEAACVDALNLGRRLAVVSDAITYRVLGERIERALDSSADVQSIVLPAGVHPDLETAARVRAATAHADGLVAVGSGTINDLVKFSAAQDGKPFAVFATAPSMNGYTSANAAITVDGHKKTLPAALTRGVFMDLEILAAAPPRMIRAGLGDSLCRPTAQVDWLLSHHLLGTTYREAPFALLAADEAILFDGPAALLSRDLEAMRALARTLVLSGIGMTLCGGSYPASQGEHLISHYIDMRSPPARADYLHGEQVAVATLTMARLQEAMLDAPPPVLRPTAVELPALQRHFGDAVGAECWHDFAPKRLDAASAAALTERARGEWGDLQAAARKAHVPASRLADVMRRASGPLQSADIGVDAAFYAGAVQHARYLRDRFTFLDLAGDAGLLKDRFVA